MPEHHIIYLPGLGDPHYKEQGVLLKLWRIYHVKVHYHPVYWRDDVPFSKKLDGIIKQIDELKARGYTISLIGTSAGASAAINAYAKREDKISGVVCICGKLRNTDKIGESYYIKNQAFKGSIALLASSLEKLSKTNRSKILSIHPLYDEIVPVKDTVIDDAKLKTIPTIGHAFSIMYSVTFGSRVITNFLKAQLP